MNTRTAMRTAILGVIFIGIALAIYNGFIKDKTVVKTGGLAPDFVLETLEGEQIQLSQLQGKGIILNFWGTWCEPCKDEMPALEQSHLKFKDQDVVVLAVDIGETDVAVKGFKDQYGLTLPILMDRKKEITQLYKIGPIPTTYFIDKDRVVKKIIVGGPMSEQTIAENLKHIAPE